MSGAPIPFRPDSPEMRLPPNHPFARGVNRSVVEAHTRGFQQQQHQQHKQQASSSSSHQSHHHGSISGSPKDQTRAWPESSFTSSHSSSLPPNMNSTTALLSSEPEMRTSSSDAGSISHDFGVHSAPTSSAAHTYPGRRPPPVKSSRDREHGGSSSSTIGTTTGTANSVPVTPTTPSCVDFGRPPSLSKFRSVESHECKACPPRTRAPATPADLAEEIANLGLECDPEDDNYDGNLPFEAIPSPRRVFETTECILRDEDGGYVRFGDLIPGPDAPKGTKTVVFFIRHLWCGICQDYTLESIARLDPVTIAAANVKVVIVSFGKWKIVRKYRELFKCPFPIYVDGPRRLYERLGMYRMFRSVKPPKPASAGDEKTKPRARYNRWPFALQMAHGLATGLFRMPLTLPGNLFQFGGEFIFSPGYKCDFSHRLTGTLSDHTEAPEVLRLAGVAIPTREVRSSDFDEERQTALAKLEAEMAEWRAAREARLVRLRARAEKLREERAAQMAAAGEAAAVYPDHPHWDEAPELSGARISLSDDEVDRNAIGVGL